MKKIFVSYFIKYLLIATVSLLLIPVLPANAETLAEYQHELFEYQSKPIDRIKNLHTEILKIRDVEEGLARQYNLPISSILRYEMIIEKNIHLYHSVYFLQKQGTSPSQFVFDEGRIGEFIRTIPPYSFLFYIDFLEDVQNCANELSRLDNIIADAKTTLNQNVLDKADAERQFRLCNEKISAGTPNGLQLSWQMREIKAKLEQIAVTQTLYSFTITITEAEANEAREKLNRLVPMLDKIRANVKFNSDDFTFLDTMIFQKNKKLSENIAMLDAKFRSRSEIRNDETGLTPFTKFRLSTEQMLVRDEILILLELVEKWSSLRLTWRGIQDILEGNLDISQQKNILSKTNLMIDDINSNIKYCVNSIQEIRETDRSIARRFSNEGALITSEDVRERDEFLIDLAARKSRYLSYIVDMGEIRDHYIDLQTETMRILKEHDTEEKIQLFWYNNFSGISDTELWHIDDYPITIGRFARAIFIFLIGILITRYLVYIFKKRTYDSSSISKHTDLLVQKLLYYIGVITSFMLGLWSLRIPLTAFAFLGGAMAIAFGLGTQKFMGDIFSGIILLFQKKLRIGDEVIIGDQQGIVEEITLQNTVLGCQQSNHLIIPNSKVLESAIINLTLNNPAIRTEINISISYDNNIDKAMELIRNILSEDKNVLKSPPFKILFEDFGRSGIKLTAQFFINLREHLERDVQSSIRQKILASFTKEKIEIPFQQTDVHIKSLNKE